MAKKRGFLVGAAVGAAIAGGLALLFAPKAGSELRQDIADKAKELSKDLDIKLAKAKREALKLKGDAKTARLETIAEAEKLKKLLDQKSTEFGTSGKKVTKVAARETDKLIQDGKVLLKDLDEQGMAASTEIGQYAKKAGKSAQKVAGTAKKEFNPKKKS